MRACRRCRRCRCSLAGWLVLLALTALGTWLPAPARAERLRLEVGRLVLEALPAHEAELQTLATRAAPLLARLEEDLGVRAKAPYRILLIPSGARRDDEMARLDALAPPWAAGFLIAPARLGGIRLHQVHRYPYDDTLSVLVHEATHMLLYDAAGDTLPRWFEEGVATWEGRRWGVRDVVVYSTALLAHRLPPLGELDREFGASAARARLAYAASFDFVSWSAGEYGPDVVARVLAEAGQRSFPEAWEAATGVRLANSETDWRRGALLVYRLVPILTGPGALWLVITLLALVAGVRRRRRTQELRRQWEEEDRRDDWADWDGDDEPVN